MGRGIYKSSILIFMKTNLRVRLHVPKKEGFCRLKAHVSKGKEVSRKYILSEIAAPGSVLARFTPEGVLRPGEEAPRHLQLEVALFYSVAVAASTEADQAGELRSIPSRKLSSRARELFYTSTPRVELMPRVG